jgi:hypothetical protein
MTVPDGSIVNKVESILIINLGNIKLLYCFLKRILIE